MMSEGLNFFIFLGGAQLCIIKTSCYRSNVQEEFVKNVMHGNGEKNAKIDQFLQDG